MTTQSRPQVLLIVGFAPVEVKMETQGCQGGKGREIGDDVLRQKSKRDREVLQVVEGTKSVQSRCMCQLKVRVGQMPVRVECQVAYVGRCRNLRHQGEDMGRVDASEVEGTKGGPRDQASNGVLAPRPTIIPDGLSEMR